MNNGTTWMESTITPVEPVVVFPLAETQDEADEQRALVLALGSKSAQAQRSPAELKMELEDQARENSELEKKLDNLGRRPQKDDRHYILRLDVEGESIRIFVCCHESKREWVHETLIPWLERHLQKSVKAEGDIIDLTNYSYRPDKLQKLLEESDKIILTLCDLYIRDSKCAYITSLCYHIKPHDTIPVGLPLLKRFYILESEPFNELISINDIIFWNNYGSNEKFWSALVGRLKARSTEVLPTSTKLLSLKPRFLSRHGRFPTFSEFDYYGDTYSGIDSCIRLLSVSRGRSRKFLDTQLEIPQTEDQHRILRLNVDGELLHTFVYYHESKREWVYETLVPWLERHLEKIVNTVDDIPMGSYQLDELQKLIEESKKIILALCNLYILDPKCIYVTQQSYHVKPHDTIPIGLPPLKISDIIEKEPFNILISINGIIFWDAQGANDKFWRKLEDRINAKPTKILPSIPSQVQYWPKVLGHL